MFGHRVAVVLLIDSQGRILLQHRSSDAPHAPNLWGLPGGQVEHGEDPLDAAHRELREETGLTVRHLALWWRGLRPGEDRVAVSAYHGVTGATQDDIVLGEGQAMVFLTPEEAVARELAPSASLLVPAFLNSAEYANARTSFVPIME
jgi:8-oxo-dGTP diphosphatase